MAIVVNYSVNKPGKETESSDKEEVEHIEDTKALRIVERLKL